MAPDFLLIKALSNSAMAPMIWSMSLREGVLKSTLSCKLMNAMPT